jgi:hypothetical protein
MPDTCLFYGAGNRCSERAALDVGTREVPVLRTSTIVALAGQTKDTQMPVSTVRRCATREGTSGLRERAVTGGMPESDLIGGEVDLVGDIMPLISLELNLPLALSSDHPLPARSISRCLAYISAFALCSQVGVARARFSVHPSILQLREVALEEADLMLVCRTRDVGCRPLNGEMIEHGSLVDGGLRLGNQLRAPHVTVPLRCAVDCDLRALFAAGIADVLEVGREIHVFGDGARSVDVVLVVYKCRVSQEGQCRREMRGMILTANLVCPTPLLKVSR